MVTLLIGSGRYIKISACLQWLVWAILQFWVAEPWGCKVEPPDGQTRCGWSCTDDVPAPPTRYAPGNTVRESDAPRGHDKRQRSSLVHRSSPSGRRRVDGVHGPLAVTQLRRTGSGYPSVRRRPGQGR